MQTIVSGYSNKALVNTGSTSACTLHPLKVYLAKAARFRGPLWSLFNIDRQRLSAWRRSRKSLVDSNLCPEIPPPVDAIAHVSHIPQSLLVRNGQDRDRAGEPVQGGADFSLGLGIEGGRGLVQDEQGRLAGQGSGQGDALALSARKLCPPFADDGIDALGQGRNEIPGAGVLERRKGVFPETSESCSVTLARMVSSKRKSSCGA